jgi:hemoglobin
MTTLFEAAGGESGLRLLALAWHERVLADPVVAGASPHGDREDEVDRVAAYWAESLGGPALHTARYGTGTEDVRLHHRDGAVEELNDRAVDCFADALDDTGLQDDEPLAEALLDWFTWLVWSTLSPPNEPAPGTRGGIPKWSWDGLVEWP